ncbi:phage terminase large subunit [Lactobacillus gallinarum]|uniref:phage terminase large subunit n=1 Tax=Lactobacillus gallinarum TaxID=52242 RepID=UPI00388D14F5
MRLTDEQKAGVALAAREELARRSYAYYFLLANADKKAQLFNYTKYVCDRLQKIVDGEQHNLIISMPPQHGKSMLVTETFPSYYLMRHPDQSIMVTSYAETMYKRFSKRGKQHFREWAPRLFGLNLGLANSQEYDVAGHYGEAYYTSILGGGTGRPANLLIIDDPIKDEKEAASQTIRDNVWGEWASTFSTRLQKNASVIVIMTRWQTDDLAGRLLDMDKSEDSEHKFNWEEIKFPAIATNIPAGQTDAIGRHNGEALNPELHPLSQLMIQKRNIGTQRFNALYQQSPTTQEGNIIKREWIKYYVPDRATMARLHLTDKDVKILPRHLQETVQGWDATFKSKENDDFVAGQVWSRRDGDFYLRPGWCHKRLSFTETLDAIRTMTRFYPQATAKLVEDKANGPAIIDTLKHEIPGVIAVSPGADSKEARAASVSPLWESGNVYVPHPKWKPEVEDWLEEIFSFPNAPHDDNVDSMVYCLQRLHKAKRRPIGIIKF